MIAAYSPEARRGSERLFRTHQDRLCKELAVADIPDMVSANPYLRITYQAAYNEEFKQPLPEAGNESALPSGNLMEERGLNGLGSSSR